uniref:EF-hand domain-containing protein n=1 Tax=Bicosoecida sp. CB-2014 TaxID=1486930 RepID=A0A7S1C5F8_9STRA|mmetsp:Transcript_14406/g.50084  ORF Transcript_14406/g.50084 Transcript_14406/m.50084 type:complete len:214 (+) Transcript_14406:187-828(+)
MGNKASKALNAKTIKGYQKLTKFEPDEIKALYNQFAQFKTTEEDGKEGAEAVINRKEFQLALGCLDSLFVDRIFQLFDKNSDGLINFEEFLVGIAILSTKSSTEQKLKFSFDLYDFNGDGKIDRDELKRLLVASLGENKVPMADAHVDALVEQTFTQADLNGDGFIDFEEYHQMVIKHPALLKPLTLNVAEIIAERTRSAAAGGATGGAGGTA